MIHDPFEAARATNNFWLSNRIRARGDKECVGRDTKQGRHMGKEKGSFGHRNKTYYQNEQKMVNNWRQNNAGV